MPGALERRGVDAVLDVLDEPVSLEPDPSRVLRTGADRPFRMSPALPMFSVMEAASLRFDLERFAKEAVAAGYYQDVGEVLADGRTEAQREAFRMSIVAAEAQGERDGFLSIDDVMRDASAVPEVMAGSTR